MDDEREIPERHKNLLHAMAGISEDEELPPKLVKKYWELCRICNRSSTAVHEAALAMLVFWGGFGEATAKEKAPLTVVELWRKKKIGRDAPIMAKRRGKEVEATLLGVTATNQVTVQFDDGHEENLKAEDVRPLEPVAA